MLQYFQGMFVEIDKGRKLGTVRGELQALEEIARLQQDAESWLNVGVAYHAQRDFPNAISAYRRSIAFNVRPCV